MKPNPTNPPEELSKAYDPNPIEEKWSRFWMEKGFFKVDPGSNKNPFCIVMPPPNVTGNLHMGHALVNTLQDTLVRWKRMLGFETLWIPGVDHAGIATQTVVEKNLMANQKKRRKDLSREDFLKLVWDWKKSSEENILKQIRRLGCSCDFTYYAFTMDEKRNRAVKAIFYKLFHEGLIYRGDYLVNWDPVTQTALADDEVEYEEKQGFLYYIRYPLEEGSGFIPIATTRPETLLGDTAIAVSPKDERYKALIGKKALAPLTLRKIPILSDPFVDPTFGTGAVKITPAHDFNDYKLGISHNLPFINIMTPDGKINEIYPPFEGLTMEEAREAILEKLKQQNLLIQVEPHQNRVGISYRSKAVIEPYLSKQWFVKMEGFKTKLQALIEKKKVQLIPKNWESTYFYWIDNLRDWCISRQLWWGHQIPVYYHKKDPSKMVCEGPDGLPPEVQKNPEDWVQDEDVLDTWFSSALWPFSTLGWPEDTWELKKFYPNSVLVTGHDILFFWVARMLFMGEYALGTPPFPEVFLHGLIFGKSYFREDKQGGVTYIKDEERKSYDLGKALPSDVKVKWEKMSKTKGNIIDPLEIIETYGTDAMRMALCSSATGGRQIDLDRRKFEDFKNFTNKIWNGARFVFLNLEDLTLEDLKEGLNPSLYHLEDEWILSLLDTTSAQVHEHLNSYSFDKAATTAYDFFWKDFCAYYVELVKPILFGKAGSLEEKKNKQKILCVILCASIRLLHPMAPFITEELFSRLKQRFEGIFKIPDEPYMKVCMHALQSPCCAKAPYPKPIKALSKKAKEVEATFQFMGELVHALRNLRMQMQIPPATAIQVILNITPQHPRYEEVKKNLSILTSLIKIESISFSEKESAFASSTFVEDIRILIPLPLELKEKEHQRLIKEKEKLLEEVAKLKDKLKLPEFMQKAPQEVKRKLQNQLDTAELALKETLHKIQKLSA